jgi:hypothetical protein
VLTGAVASYALWGAAGAFIYAAPKLVLCFFTARAAKLPWGRCLAEFPVSMLTGTIMAAAFSQWISKTFGQGDMSAVAAVIGMMANTVAPGMIEGAPTMIQLMSGMFVKKS